MKYDFETLQTRKGTGSNKWDMMYRVNPSLPDNIVPLSVADMEFKNPPQIAEGVSNYMKNSILGYTYATDSYYESVINWMQRRHNWKIKREWFVDYPGVVPALFQLVSIFTKEDEKVLLLTPVYYPFYNAVIKGGRTLVESRLVLKGNRYEIDYKDFEEKAKDPKTTMVILCNPHNPVSRVWSKEELAKIGRICIDNDVLMVSDEIHGDLIMPGYNFTPLASVSEEIAQHSIICTAPSKTFNVAGLLTSNLIIPNESLKNKVFNYRNDHAIYFCNMLGYKACEIAYNECEDWLEELLIVLNENRILIKNFMNDYIPEINVIELEGTYLQWLDCRKLGMSPKELEKFMVDEAYLFVDEGYVFGEAGEGFERINLACPTWVLKESLERMYTAWQKHKNR